jgi:hypothetical protein
MCACHQLIQMKNYEYFLTNKKSLCSISAQGDSRMTYMVRGMIPGPIWKISCYNLLITYLTMTEISNIQENLTIFVYGTNDKNWNSDLY